MHLHHPRGRTPLLLLLLTSVLLLPVGAPVDARAALGDYSVRLTSTNGGHWNSYGRGNFSNAPLRVFNGTGSFVAGDYRSWRMGVPGEGARITGGRISGTIATPAEQVSGRIVVGTGSASTVLYDGDGSGTVVRSIPTGEYGWFQFDLRTTSAVTLPRAAENTMGLSAAELTMYDTVAPVSSIAAVPAPTAWHDAAACIPFAVQLDDQGGGLARAQVRRAATGAVVTEWTAAMAESPKPGPSSYRMGDCIGPGERDHGDTAYVATVWDVGGRTHESSFVVRADQVPPTIGGGPAEGTRFTTTNPKVEFAVGDDGSGLARAFASIDGEARYLELGDGVLKVSTAGVPIGRHTVSAIVFDAAGNGATVERRFTIADDEPPVITVTSPGARGESTVDVVVAARATDDFSGVDPASWTLRLDDQAVAFTGDAAALSAKLGKLATGGHKLALTVRDRSGNTGSVVHQYYVVAPPPPPTSTSTVAPTVNVTVPQPDPAALAAAATAAAEAGAAAAPSGVSIVDAPRTPVQFGQRATVTVHVARLGRPVTGQLVELQRDGQPITGAITDDAGVARLTFLAPAPGAFRAVAPGAAVDPAPVPLRVAPRLVIATSTGRPRVGQRVAITGRIYPAIRGRRVAVEARIDGVWYPIRRAASTGTNGRFRSTVVATTRGTVWVRVRLLAVGNWAPATSNQRALVVRR